MCTEVSSLHPNLTTLLFCSLIFPVQELLPRSEAYWNASLMSRVGLLAWPQLQ
jgi:hypothetical protein